MVYEPRGYREWVQTEDLVRTEVSVGESDLLILCREAVGREAKGLLTAARAELLSYLVLDPEFEGSLEPRRVLPGAPPIARAMSESAARFGVGPMAAVAGAVAERVGLALAERFGDVIVENGGDIFVSSLRPISLGFHAGDASPFSGRLSFRVTGMGKVFGVCTSSGTFGHSLSFGKADAVTVVCAGCADADAAATALANLVEGKEDVDRVVDEAKKHNKIKGIIVAKEDRMGIWGAVEVI